MQNTVIPSVDYIGFGLFQKQCLVTLWIFFKSFKQLYFFSVQTCIFLSSDIPVRRSFTFVNTLV